MEYLFYTKVNYSNHHAVEAEDEKGADGDEGDDADFDIVE
jgi:hypothetical protein